MFTLTCVNMSFSLLLDGRGPKNEYELFIGSNNQLQLSCFHKPAMPCPLILTRFRMHTQQHQHAVWELANNQTYIKQRRVMHQKFNTSKQYLSQKIFIPEPPQQGQVWTNLNVTLLPDYLAYIKQILTKEQQMLLSDYHLQTYLLETALKPHPKNDFDSCTSDVLAHLRSHPEFWVRQKGAQQQSLKMHQAVEQYHRDCEVIKECVKGSQSIGLQTQYRARREKKVREDYLYSGNPFIKGAYRFVANMYPALAQYLLTFAPEAYDKQQFRGFLAEVVLNLGSKAKSRNKSYQPYFADQNSEFANQIEEEVKLFTDYAINQNIETKSLSSARDYYIIANALIIGKSFLNLTLPQTSTEHLRSQELPKKLDEVFADLVNRFINKQQLVLLLEVMANGQYRKSCEVAEIREKKELVSKDKWVGLHSSEPEAAVQRALKTYSQMVNHPENTNRMKYKLEGSEVGWTDELYLKFLQKFLEFFNVPTNNKKIALAMGKGIEPNHVKHVKGIYMRNMTVRMDNGEIGGGKKGIFESKLQFLKKDLENFNMKWFKKQSKTKMKKLKRKRKRQTFDEEQHDSDY